MCPLDSEPPRGMWAEARDTEPTQNRVLMAGGEDPVPQDPYHSPNRPDLRTFPYPWSWCPAVFSPVAPVPETLIPQRGGPLQGRREADRLGPNPTSVLLEQVSAHC